MSKQKGNGLPTSTEGTVINIADHAHNLTPPNHLLEELKSDPDIQIGMVMEGLRQEAAQKLRQWRSDAKLTQIEVAEKMRTTQKQVSRMESCTNTGNNITLDMMARYAHACGIQIAIAGAPIKTNVTSLEDQA